MKWIFHLETHDRDALRFFSLQDRIIPNQFKLECLNSILRSWRLAFASRQRERFTIQTNVTQIGLKSVPGEGADDVLFILSAKSRRRFANPNDNNRHGCFRNILVGCRGQSSGNVGSNGDTRTRLFTHSPVWWTSLADVYEASRYKR